MKALVTGGGGFLGGRIVRALRERGDQPIALGRNNYPDLEELGIQTIQADIRDPDSVYKACKGIDTVFHVAALAGFWGRRVDFESINVGGTRNVIDACKKAGVSKLVYTSSPSVVFGTEPICGADESQPYPDRYLAHYPATKAAAERLVLAANGADFSTVALRPHLIWGPGDPHLIPRVVDRARAGKLKQIGDGTNLVDITYVDNAADAHVLAADVLSPGSSCAGKPYFISQGAPVPLWGWINDLLGRLGVDPVARQVSPAIAHAAGAVFEAIYGVLRLRSDPPMTRFVASQLSKSHYFDISAARRDFGYEPRISTDEGTERLVSWMQSQPA
jgi:2-alkyl-3-oxoalkanoate reductase